MKNVDANITTIVESNDKPKIIKWEQEFTNSFIKNNIPCFADIKYKIYIPENSIKFNYDIDLK